MKISKSKETTLKFVEAINSASICEMVDLMTDDHTFIDSGDGKYQGKEFMKQGWIGYFDMFPDYRIEIVHIMENGDIVGIFGYASGAYRGLKNEMNSNFFRIPASWKVIVEINKIKLWQVYCETKIIEKIIEKENGNSGR